MLGTLVQDLTEEDWLVMARNAKQLKKPDNAEIARHKAALTRNG